MVIVVSAPYRNRAAGMAQRRYRSKGQQTVHVERVTVQDGDQAIAEAVEAGGGRDEI